LNTEKLSVSSYFDTAEVIAKMSKVETSESELRDIEKFTKHLIYKFVQVRVLCYGYMDVKTNAYHYADHKVSKWV